jgi:DNA-binding transcriptional MerR regulator
MSDPNECGSNKAPIEDSSRTDIEKAIEIWERMGNLLRELSDTASLSAGGIANLFFRIEELLSLARRILIGEEEIRLRIPAKRYYSMREVSELLEIEPYVLRYWQIEFCVGKPPVGQGRRIRYPNYSRRELREFLTIKRLCYEEKYTIGGAKRRLFQIREQESKKNPQRKPQKTVYVEPLQVSDIPARQQENGVLEKHRNLKKLGKSQARSQESAGFGENGKD